MNTKLSENDLLFGANHDAGLVAVEHEPASGHANDKMTLLFRSGDTISSREEDFTPYLWLNDTSLMNHYDRKTEVIELSGSNVLKTLVMFPSWKELDHCVRWMKKETGFNPSDPNAPYFLINDPVQQYLMLSGRTLFKDMLFTDIKRLQLDIETYTAEGYEFSNPERDADRIIAIALADSSGWSEVLSGQDLSESELIEKLISIIHERDPDVIEGHNIFNYDLPYLTTRSKKCGIKFEIGRNHAIPTSRSSRLTIADATIAYKRFDIYGRHVIDTYFLAQAYDVMHRSMESLGLKAVAHHFGVAADQRVYLEGSDIAHTFDTDPEKVMKYAHDDIIETRAISNILSPSYAVQAQILPFTYQNICVKGNGTKIDALMLRAYLLKHEAIPKPDTARQFAGGYTDIFETGVLQNVHHCDVRSLYPSLMIKHELTPATDTLKVFQTLLTYLRDLRFAAKENMLKAKQEDEKHYQDALQSTLKVLINSFYGYLGFLQARFNDFSVAETVTREGRNLLNIMIQFIKSKGGTPIEIDTDGIYYVPPDLSTKAIESFRNDFIKSLPDGIDVEFDGDYVAMYSYKMKNYALLDADGELVIKGAALKSRGLEPFQREFMEQWLRLKLEGKDKEIDTLIQSWMDNIQHRRWPIQKLAKTERLQDSPATYKKKIEGKSRGRNAAYELALVSDRDYKAGDRISYYVTGDKKSVAVYQNAKLVSDWDPDNRDENVPYYLSKFESTVKKFHAIKQTNDSEEVGGQGMLF